jgi:tripartite-type tricarboxylate transporter receptor subunit TctC
MRLFTIFASLLAIAPVAADAQDWPGNKPLRLEIIAGAGGLPDTIGRVLANAISPAIGVPMVVENRPGAGGNIAAGAVAKAAPDGHTLLVTSTNQAVNPTLLPDPGFDYERDLVPVSMVAATKLLVVAAPSFPAKDLTDVIAIAKREPNSVRVAMPTIGTPNHLAAEMIAQYAGVELTFVPYDVIVQAIPDIMAGRVDIAVGAITTMLPLARSGAVKPLAMVSPQRSPLAPDIPTAAEAGFPQLQIDNWICVMTTGGTPAPIITRLDAEIAKALALPEVRDAWAKLGIDVFHLNPEQLEQFLQTEAARFKSLLLHSRMKRAAP